LVIEIQASMDARRIIKRPTEYFEVAIFHDQPMPDVYCIIINDYIALDRCLYILVAVGAQPVRNGIS